MAVNFIRINLFRQSSVLFPLTSLWNVYRQILIRHNSEDNKDNLDKIMNLINGNGKVKVPDKSILLLKNYHENPLYFDGEKLLMSSMNDQSIMSSKKKWINFRLKCIQHIMCNEECSINFYDKFIKLTQKIDPVYYEENEELFDFLYRFIAWKSNDLKNIDMLINRLSRLYEKSTKGGGKGRENNETLIHQLKILTHTLIEDVISKHGSSVIVKLRNSFEDISKETRDYEMLYILWRKLFESFWYSDQNSADEIIERHKEVRNLLAARSKFLCFQYFNNDNTEHVNKIIQIFLKYNMKENASNIIKMHLKYSCWQKSSSEATEIVRLCIALNIPLTEDENNMFLNLLLRRTSSMNGEQEEEEKLVKLSDDDKKGEKVKKSSIQKYKFKF